MGIITETAKSSTGLQINAWNTEILSNISNIEKLKASLLAQLENMKVNKEDFTEEDIIEMEELLAEIDKRISTL
jgi:hypothetical protein